jgi:hypothetical protein
MDICVLVFAVCYGFCFRFLNVEFSTDFFLTAHKKNNLNAFKIRSGIPGCANPAGQLPARLGLYLPGGGVQKK